jgi:predicted RNA binding protein with dsRBD fold (UPF0201 family)
MDEVIVHIEAEVNPTESEQKVKKAIENVLGNVALQTISKRKGSLLAAEAHGREALIKLYNLLRREHIRAAARVALFEGLDRKTLSFCLNKQVAYAGHVSFAKEVAESPLGPIKIKISCEDPKELIHWLTSEVT